MRSRRSRKRHYTFRSGMSSPNELEAVATVGVSNQLERVPVETDKAMTYTETGADLSDP